MLIIRHLCNVFESVFVNRIPLSRKVELYKLFYMARRSFKKDGKPSDLRTGDALRLNSPLGVNKHE